MTKQEAEQEIDRLVREIRRCDQLYYVEAAPDISDYEYDMLMKRLEALEKEFPELASPSSPTRRIGDKLDGKAEVVRHQTPMLSIANVYDEGSLREFVDSAQKEFDRPLAWVCELKIDGVAAALIYENREFVRALTRGDGIMGEDFTANARTIHDIPLRLPDDAPDYLEVRGEVYMTNANLSRLNEEGRAQALASGREFKPYANARNLTAGTIKQRDPQVCADRRLRFFAHSTGTDPSAVAATHAEFMSKLRSFGFPTAPLFKRLPNFEEAYAYVQEMQTRLHELDFEVDGIVLKVDDFAARDELGATSKYPKWLVACKF
ncbi:MAG: NAD-dependent DNA ligase LigA, partial [Thermoguttaceae bacterium]|nr:NAD-dependent DNA ligase LigA [Thermoguttaceae bacterium]